MSRFVLHVSNLSESLRFYRNLLDVDPVEGEEVSRAEFRIGDQAIVLSKAPRVTLDIRLHHLAFEVESIETSARRLRVLGIHPVDARAEVPLGDRGSVQYSDPDGHLILLVESGTTL